LWDKGWARGVSSHEPDQFVYAGVLVVMDPPNAVEVANGSHVFWKFFCLRPLEVVQNWYDVAFVFQSTTDLLKKDNMLNQLTLTHGVSWKILVTLTHV
jgi:hypothetical protein